jgi:hypothetical protein
MSLSAQRDAAGAIERDRGDDLPLFGPVRKILSARQYSAALAYIELRRRAHPPPPIAETNWDRPKVDSSRRACEPSIPHDRERFEKLKAALPNPATRRVLADILDGVGLHDAGRRVVRAHYANWMPSVANKSGCILLAKFLLLTGLDCIADVLDSQAAGMRAP